MSDYLNPNTIFLEHLEKKISDKVNQSIKIEFSKNPDGHGKISVQKNLSGLASW